MSEQGFFSRLFGGQGRSNEGSAKAEPAEQYFTYQAQQDPREIERLHAAELEAMDELLDKLSRMELPDAIDLVMLGPSMDDDAAPGSGFARYAARLFADVGASRIRQIAATTDIGVIRLSKTGQFWMRMPYLDFPEEDLSCALAAESAMNRLLFIRNAFAGFEGAASWSEGDCCLADLSWIRRSADAAVQLLRGAEENHLLEIYRASGARGGQWDVRTRFAVAVEQLKLPFRLSYTYDCNPEQGIFHVDFSIPLSEWFPQHLYDVELGQWVDYRREADKLAAFYANALGALLASIAFSTSVGIRQVHLVGHLRDIQGEAAFSRLVDRLVFLGEVIPRIERRDNEWLRPFMGQPQASSGEANAVLFEQHPALESDQRALPAGLAEQLCAQVASELDVISDMADEPWDSLHAAEKDRVDFPLAAVAVLEDIAAKGDRAAEQAEPGTVPLYCSDAVARFLLPLVDLPPARKYLRYSDASFRARSILCDIYCEMGEPDRAIEAAKRCIELAPTSPIGYTDLVNALFAKDDHGQAIPYLEQALAIATNGPSIAFIYYRLAFALWQTGRRETALACYVMCLHHNFDRHDVVTAEIQELLSEMATVSGEAITELPSVSEAIETLQREGIAVAPTAAVREHIAAVAIELVDKGFPEAAAPLVRLLATTLPDRDELFAVAASLRA